MIYDDIEKMGSQELACLKDVIKEREIQLAKEDKKLIWEISTRDSLEGNFKEEDFDKAMDEVIKIAQKAKDYYYKIRNSSGLTNIDIRETLTYSYPKVRSRLVSESDYRIEFEDE